MKKHRILILAILLLVMSIAGCKKDDHKATVVEKNLLGVWQQITETEIFVMIFQLELQKDDIAILTLLKFDVDADIATDKPIDDVPSEGTYSIEGDKITLLFPKALHPEQTYTFTLDAEKDHLTLVDLAGVEAFAFTRKE